MHQRTLLEHTLDSFDLRHGDTLLITCQAKDHLPQNLHARLQKRLPGITIRWHEINNLEPGQLATAQKSVNHLLIGDQGKTLEQNSLLIHNCDTSFNWSEDCLPNDYDGSMPVFVAEGDHWSFGLPDPLQPHLAIKITEKSRISTLASIGLYGFRSIKKFQTAAKWQLNHAKPINEEFYIAPLLQTLIDWKQRITLPRVRDVRIYGTPKELCETFEISIEELIADNK